MDNQKLQLLGANPAQDRDKKTLTYKFLVKLDKIWVRFIKNQCEYRGGPKIELLGTIPYENRLKNGVFEGGREDALKNVCCQKLLKTSAI